MYDFANAGHVSDYLTDTVVGSSKFGPVYVQAIYDHEVADVEDIVMSVKPLPWPERKGEHLKIHEIDFRPLTIGMCNLLDREGMPAEAAYCVRIPARRWKVGLSNAGIRPFPVRMGDPDEWHPWIFEPGGTGQSWLVRNPGAFMILNDYPSYEKSMECMEPFDRRSCAFSRNFAMDAEGKLFYRWHNEAVGKCQSQPQLYAKYDALKEVLEEDGY